MRAAYGLALMFVMFVPSVRADGGTVRLSVRENGYRITVFTSPTPLRVGPVDVSVLVQDADRGEPMRDVAVLVRLTPIDPTGPVLEQSASREAATNKLYQAALFELPTAGAGRWQVEIQVEGEQGLAQGRFEMEVGESLPRWATMWLWIAWPVVAVMLFSVHQVLTRRPAGKAW